MRPFALVLTWTCYGTWLPGDFRGYVSNTYDAKLGYLPRQNSPGTPYTANDPVTLKRAQEAQKHESYLLDEPSAGIAATALISACTKRNWQLARSALMFNHAHVVVMECPNDGPGVRRILKGNSQAALNDAEGITRRRWTAGGCDRYLNDWPAIGSVNSYVEQQEGILVRIANNQIVTTWPSEPPG